MFRFTAWEMDIFGEQIMNDQDLQIISFIMFVFSGLFDQIIHSADNIDVVELFKHLHPKASNNYTSSFIKWRW